MNGDMMLYGYHFSQKVHINFSEHMVFLSKNDHSLAYNIFDFLDRFFTRKRFSDTFLDQGLGICLNGNSMKGTEFHVYHLPSIIHGVEELKVLKKNIFGQFLQCMVQRRNKTLDSMVSDLQTYILNPINQELLPYHLRYRCGDEEILNLCKSFVLEVLIHDDEVIDVADLDQFSLKMMLIDFIEKLPTKQMKLLLIEYPEYGLTFQQSRSLFCKLAGESFDHVMISTQAENIKEYFPSIYSYHVINENGICGFDEYDELECLIQEQHPMEAKDIEKQVIAGLFSQGCFIDFLDEYIRRNTN